jgi:hypothetical protein
MRFRFSMGPAPAPTNDMVRGAMSERIDNMAEAAVELGIEDRLATPLAAARESLALADVAGTRHHLAIALAAIAEAHEWRIEHEARQR